MSIVQSEIQFFQSANANSAGGAISASQISDNVLNNLFSDTPAASAYSGAVDYRKCFVKNANASLSLQNALFFKTTSTPSPDDEIYVGIGTSSDDDGSQELAAVTLPSAIVLVSSAADTRVVTLVGEDVNGSRLSETVTLNGTTPVTSANTYSKLYTVSVASSNTNTVTVTQNTGTIVLGKLNSNKLSCIYYQNVTTKSAAFKLGTIASGASIGLWLKRVTLSGANQYTSNSCQLEIFGNTT